MNEYAEASKAQNALPKKVKKELERCKQFHDQDDGGLQMQASKIFNLYNVFMLFVICIVQVKKHYFSDLNV